MPTVPLRPVRRGEDESGAGLERGAKDFPVSTDDPETESDGGFVHFRFSTS